jgi:hypothetical protein
MIRRFSRLNLFGMATNLELAKPISSKVEIGSINLREADVQSRIDPFTGVPAEVVLSQSFRATYKTADPDQVAVFVEMNFAADAEDPNDGTETGEPLVTLRAVFVVTYNLDDVADYPKSALQAFAELNGPYNAWPYWRELVQSVGGRVGLATIIIPVLKLPVREMPPEEVSRAAKRERKVPRRRPPTDE